MIFLGDIYRMDYRSEMFKPARKTEKTSDHILSVRFVMLSFLGGLNQETVWNNRDC